MLNLINRLLVKKLIVKWCLCWTERMVLLKYTFKDLHAGKYFHKNFANKEKQWPINQNPRSKHCQRKAEQVSQQSTRRPGKTL